MCRCIVVIDAQAGLRKWLNESFAFRVCGAVVSSIWISIQQTNLCNWTPRARLEESTSDKSFHSQRTNAKNATCFDMRRMMLARRRRLRVHSACCLLFPVQSAPVHPRRLRLRRIFSLGELRVFFLLLLSLSVLVFCYRVSLHCSHLRVFTYRPSFSIQPN